LQQEQERLTQKKEPPTKIHSMEPFHMNEIYQLRAGTKLETLARCIECPN